MNCLFAADDLPAVDGVLWMTPLERAGARHETMAEESPLVTALMSAGALGTEDQIREIRHK